jgi:hypothetical protein
MMQTSASNDVVTNDEITKSVNVIIALCSFIFTRNQTRTQQIQTSTNQANGADVNDDCIMPDQNYDVNDSNTDNFIDADVV